MADKRINKILWHGNELDDEGRAKAPSVAEGSDGLDGLNDGEVYICNADEDPAMFIRTDAGRVVRVGGGSVGDTYTKDEINQKLSAKVDTAFFSRLFGLMTDTGEEIAVNDVNAAGSSILAKFGLYTEQFLSALGLNPGGGGGGGGGATTLGELANVGEWADEVPTADRVLVQLAGATHWSSKPLSELVGLDEEALAAYLVGNGYATQKWVNTKLGSYATTSAMNLALGNKVDKVAGKGLSSNDFTDALLTKLNGIEAGANKYTLPTATASVLGGVKVGATLAIASGVLNMKAVGTAGTYTKVTVDAYGRVTGHASLAAGDIPNLPWSKITSGKPSTLAGYGITDAYTKQETDAKLSAKLDKATFEELFEKVQLSDGTFAIHAKFGLYSDSFLSALGMNPDGGSGGGASSLSELSDVSLSGLQDGQALTWDAAAQKWMNKTLEAGLDEEALAEYLASNNYLTAATGDNRYVKKTGDTMTGTLRVRSASNPYGALLTGDSSSGYLQLGNMSSTSAEQKGIICGYSTANLASLNVKGTTNDVLKVNSYTVLNTGNYTSTLDGRYVKKSGDTMTGNLNVMKLSLGNDNEINSSDRLYLAYRNTPLGVNVCLNNAPFTYGSGNYTIWHSGNDGSGSGLDADTVDGVHNGSLAAAVLNSQGRSDMITGKPAKTGLQVFDVYGGTDTGYPTSYGNLLRLRGGVSGGSGELLLGWSGSNNGIERVYYRNIRDMADSWSAWRTLAFTTDNVASATKLQTARTIWGQTFDGTGNVSGSMTGVGSITMSGGIKSSASPFYIDSTSGDIALRRGASNANGVSLGNGNFRPISTSSGASGITLGSSDYRWANVFSVTGNFSEYVYSVNGWFQCNTSGRGLYNSSQSARWYATGGCWNSDKPIIPNTNNTQSLGTSSYKWNYLYVTNARVTGTTTDTLTVNNTTTLKGLVTINGRSSIGCSGFGVGLQLIDTGSTSLEIVGGSYVYGLGAHSNSSFYMWRGTQGHSSSTGKEYISQFDGTNWIVWGNIRPHSNNVYTIGTSSYRWNYGYFTNMNLNGTLAVSGAATLSSTLAVTGLATMNGGVHTPNDRYYSTFNTAGTYCAIAGIDASNYVFFGTTENTAGTIIRAYSTVLFNFNGLNNSVRINKEGIWAQNGIWTDGYVSALGQTTTSDMRLKDKLADIHLPVEAVAAAPAMLFAWKRNGLRDVGSSAQYWQGILPEAVKERGGWLEMEYGNLALVSAISIAKKVVSHEERIAQLEKENIGLKNKIKELERRM